MIDATIQTDVLIIGAGPTGLSLACQLAGYGIDFVILEQHEGVTPYSKALGVHDRTFEVYEQVGLAQSAVEQGAITAKSALKQERSSHRNEEASRPKAAITAACLENAHIKKMYPHRKVG